MTATRFWVLGRYLGRIALEGGDAAFCNDQLTIDVALDAGFLFLDHEHRSDHV